MMSCSNPFGNLMNSTAGMLPLVFIAMLFEGTIAQNHHLRNLSSEANESDSNDMGISENSAGVLAILVGGFCGMMNFLLALRCVVPGILVSHYLGEWPTNGTYPLYEMVGFFLISSYAFVGFVAPIFVGILFLSPAVTITLCLVSVILPYLLVIYLYTRTTAGKLTILARVEERSRTHSSSRHARTLIALRNEVAAAAGPGVTGTEMTRQRENTVITMDETKRKDEIDKILTCEPFHGSQDRVDDKEVAGDRDGTQEPSNSALGAEQDETVIVQELEQSDHAQKDNLATCCICLDAYQQDDIVAKPTVDSCPHMFHHQCIQGWLLQHNDCPECRENLFKPP